MREPSVTTTICTSSRGQLNMTVPISEMSLVERYSPRVRRNCAPNFLHTSPTVGV